MNKPWINTNNVVALLPSLMTFTFRTTRGTYAILFDVDAHTYAIVSTDSVVLQNPTILPTGTQKRQVFDYQFARELLQAYFRNFN